MPVCVPSSLHPSSASAPRLKQQPTLLPPFLSPRPSLQGSYMSLGMLNSVADWRNAGIAIVVIVLAIGANTGYSKISEATSDRRRQRALEELEGKGE